jgi:Undecaprenyl-phosphate galactose phosphotransferase WbaP
MQGAVEGAESRARKRSDETQRTRRRSPSRPKINRQTPPQGPERPKSATRPQAINRFKRALDLLIALPVLVFVSPLMLVLAIAIRMQDGGPALYRQARLGFGGRSFICFKFRTMVLDADERLEALLARDPEAAKEWQRDHKLRNDPRVLGTVGRFLRVTSLDELPQLFNIIRGEMSVVGPRPIVTEEIVRYSSYFRYYTAVRPGVTGLWQVSGRNNVSYEKRVWLDATYARKWCVALDLWILWRTVPAVLFRRGAY